MRFFVVPALLALSVLPTGGVGSDGVIISFTSATAITFIGQGAGHGVGMSQWGARGRALAGQSAADILAAYYPDTIVSTQGDDSEPIRVLTGPDKIQTMPLSLYLDSVVSTEMPNTFPDAALQAQAIASRTYALWEMNPAKPYDVTGTISDQAYGASPNATSIAAVAATRGQVLTYGGKVIVAYFHECSPYMTESNQDAFGQLPLPYLQSVSDVSADGAPYGQACPRFSWQSGPFTTTQLSTILDANPATSVGTLQSLTFSPLSPSNRWESVTITGSAGTKTVLLRDFRAVMNAHAPAGRSIFSADFTVSSTTTAPMPVSPQPVISFVL